MPLAVVPGGRGTIRRRCASGGGRGGRRHVADAEGCGVHAERLTNSSVDEILPRLAGGALEDLVGDEIHRIAVDVSGAQVGLRLEVVDPPEDFLRGEIGRAVEQLIASRQARAMGKRSRMVMCDSKIGIAELEFGQMFDDGVVPLKLAVVDQQGKAGSGERFGTGCDVKGGIRCDFAIRAELA